MLLQPHGVCREAVMIIAVLSGYLELFFLDVFFAVFLLPFFALFLAVFFAPFLGTFAPFFRASDSPIAIACLRLFTVFPLRPLFS